MLGSEERLWKHKWDCIRMSCHYIWPLKNVLQFPSISAHNLIWSNMVFQYSHHHSGFCGVNKSDPTHETVTFFLHYSIKIATYSLGQFEWYWYWRISIKVMVCKSFQRAKAIHSPPNSSIKRIQWDSKSIDSSRSWHSCQKQLWWVRVNYYRGWGVRKLWWRAGFYLSFINFFVLTKDS